MRRDYSLKKIRRVKELKREIVCCESADRDQNAVTDEAFNLVVQQLLEGAVLFNHQDAKGLAAELTQFIYVARYQNAWREVVNKPKRETKERGSA